MDSYLGHPEFSKRGTLRVGRPGSLSSCVANNCVTQLVIYLFQMDVFEMGVLAVQSLISSTYATVRVVIVDCY